VRVSLAGQSPLPEPPAKRLLRLAGFATRQETRHADIFIQLRPVDALATSNQTPVGALRWRPACQSREPSEGHRDRPAIREVNGQSIIAYAYALGQRCFKFSPRSRQRSQCTQLGGLLSCCSLNRTLNQLAGVLERELVFDVGLMGFDRLDADVSS
jgi:hypothetical protein